MSEERDYVELDRKFSQWLKMKERANNSQYPAFYAGNRLEEDGSYTFYLTAGEQTKTVRKEILNMVPDAKFEETAFSYQELYDYYEYLNQSAVCRNEISGYYIDDERNAVVIMTEDNPLELKERFLQEFKDAPFLIFEEEAGPEEEVQIGEKITGVFVNGPAGDGSMGFPAREDLTGQEGFVTTQHSADIVGGSFFDQNHTLIGTAVSALHAGSADACFVQNQQGHTVDKWSAYGGTYIIGYYSPRFLKVPVAKHGFQTGKTSGRILSMHFSNRISQNQLISDLYRADYQSGPGDSGGAVTCCGFVIGIHRAGKVNGQGRHRTAVCKYCNIRDSLGISGM